MKKILLTLGLLLAVCAHAAAQESPVKLTGQVVCSDCWFEAKDRAATPYGTAADLTCAADCAKRGIPTALAVRTGEGSSFALYLLEEGRFRVGDKRWLPFMAKQVEVSGATRRAGDRQFFKVDSLTVVGDSPAAQAAAAAVGTEAELVLRDLYGAEQRLSALRGRVVVLNFWATWCEPCRKEMPDLAAIQNDYAALGVQVVGASADEAADRAKVLKFIKEAKVNFPVWTGATSELMPRFGLAPALPGTVLIDREGKIVSASNAPIDAAALRKQLDALLARYEKQARAEAPVAGGHKHAADEHGHGTDEHERGASTVPS
jgi:thiol-disulfide isomerase/thioredoxin